MKKKISLIIMVLVIVVIIICIVSYNKNNFVIDSIKEFDYSYSNGWSINNNTIYNIKCKDKCIATIKPNGVAEEEQLEIEIDQDTINKVISILNEYKVSRWNGFNKVDKLVLDGNSFSLKIKLGNGKEINASGYMKWPKNYTTVKTKLDNIFMNIYNKTVNS